MKSLAAGLVLVAFVPAFGLRPYHDDWGYALEALDAARAGRAWDFIWGRIAWHWSPLSSAFEILTVRAAGVESDVLVRAINAAALFGSLLLFHAVASRWLLSRSATFAGMGLVAFAQINAHPFYSFDAYTQLWCDTLAWASLGCALLAMTSPARDAAWRRLLAVSWVCFVLAVAAKEPALAALAGLCAIAWWFTVVEPVDPARQRGMIVLAIAAAAAGGALMAMRIAIAGWLADDDPYNTFCPSCMPGHLGLQIAGNVAPINTMDVYVGFRTGGWSDPTAVVGALAGVVVVTAIAGGLLLARRAPASRVGLIVMLAATSSLGTVMLGRVFERHAHALVFWIALLVAAAWDGSRRAEPEWVGRAGRAVLIAMIAGQFVALYDKLGEMRASGERAHAWAVRIEDAIRGLPPGSAVLVGSWPNVRGDRDYDQIRITPPSQLLWLGAALRARGQSEPFFRSADDPALSEWLKAHDPRGVYTLVVSDDGIVLRPGRDSSR